MILFVATPKIDFSALYWKRIGKAYILQRFVEFGI